MVFCCEMAEQLIIRSRGTEKPKERSILWLVWVEDIAEDMINSRRWNWGKGALKNIWNKAVFDFYTVFFIAGQTGA